MADNDDKDNGKILPFEEFLRRRFPGPAGRDIPPSNNNGTPPQHPPVDPGILPMAPQAALAAARMELAAYFSLMADPNNPGIKMLKGDPQHQLIEAVWHDDLGRVFTINALTPVADFNKRWFWPMNGDLKDTRFVTPAHVVRSHTMAVALARHNIDFFKPDSDGRTPLHYIAAHGQDAWLLPYLVLTHKVDVYDGGRCSHDHDVNTAKGERYDEPLLAAIRAGNAEMVNGFLMLHETGDIDMNRPRNNWSQTPLMLAVQEATEAAMNWPGHGPGRQELLRRLWIVREMAGEKNIDADYKDAAGNTARDYALAPSVRGALDQGLMDRRTPNHQPRLTRNGGPPGP